MAQLVRVMTLLLLFGLASAAQGDEPTTYTPPLEPVASEQAPSPLTGTFLEWVVVGVCLCVTLCAGGFTFLCYLRRRDALETLAALEARYRPDSGKSQDFE